MPITTDLAAAYDALNNKQNLYTKFWRYYDGDQPLVYNAERLREVFSQLNARFVQNWCAVVVDAILERITLTGFQAGDDVATTELEQLFTDSGLALDSDDAHLAALLCGEAFVLVWPDEAGVAQAYYNDPRLCAMFYDSENPRVRTFAAKWWVGDNGKRYITLYYPDRLEYYVSAGKAENVQTAEAFGPTEEGTAPNPYQEIPVFHIRRERRGIISELANVITLQDAINKLLADMMVAAEFGAYRQRYVISNADTSALKNMPGVVWDLAAGDGTGQPTSAGEFGETNLGNYLSAIDKLATSIAIITRTPKHYFFADGGQPSGEALIVQEAPLNKKAQHYISRFSATWQQVAAFMARISGLAVSIAQIAAQFAPVATVQPRTEAEITQMNVAAGMPLVTSLRRSGWTQAELDQLEEDQRAASAAQQKTLAQAMLDAARRFDQGLQNGPPMNGGSGNGREETTGQTAGREAGSQTEGD